MLIARSYESAVSPSTRIWSGAEGERTLIRDLPAAPRGESRYDNGSAVIYPL